MTYEDAVNIVRPGIVPAPVARPTYDEFVIAREKAKEPSPEGESAYQVCRWYRGQMFYRATAELALRRIREAQS
jgi:hypothetical protein